MNLTSELHVGANANNPAVLTSHKIVRIQLSPYGEHTRPYSVAALLMMMKLIDM